MYTNFHVMRFFQITVNSMCEELTEQNWTKLYIAINTNFGRCLWNLEVN